MNLVADGNINPCRFVTPSGDFSVIQSVAGDLSCGISTDATKAAPVSGASTLAAADGDHVNIHGVGVECLLEAGTGGWSAGSLLKPDSVGRGVVADVTGNDQVGARAIQGAAAGEFARVLVAPMKGV